MKTARIAIKRAESPPSLAAAAGPVFALLDPPGVYDRDGDRMGAGNLRLPPGHRDVPLYWDHSHREEKAVARIPIGRAVVWREGDQWYMQPKCDLVDDLSRTIAAKVEAGTIDACSIGYITLAATPNGAGPSGRGEDVITGELVEVSLTGIGAKAGAVRVKHMAKWKTMEEAQAGFEQMAADLEECKAMLAQVLERLPKPTTEKDAPPPEDTPPADEGPVSKWFRGLSPAKR
jgi:hypothetical protein